MVLHFYIGITKPLQESEDNRGVILKEKSYTKKEFIDLLIKHLEKTMPEQGTMLGLCTIVYNSLREFANARK